MILVTGATGNVGGAALRWLVAGGHAVRAGVRDLGAALPAGVEPVCLDFEDPGTWASALDGVTHLLLVRPPALTDMAATLLPFLDAAPALQHVAFLSVAGAGTNPAIPHAKVEAHLRASAVGWTFLRAGFFSQNLLGPYGDDIREDDRLFVPAGKGRAAWVDARDVGEAGARALLDPTTKGQVWLLTGPEALDFDAVAAILTEELGRPIVYTAANPLFYAKHVALRRGQPWSAAAVMTLLHLAIRFGDETALAPTLRERLGRPPRTVRDLVRESRARWAR
jgi:uncharacterized protein YbjT (DUF2867 family)